MVYDVSDYEDRVRQEIASLEAEEQSVCEVMLRQLRGELPPYTAQQLSTIARRFPMSTTTLLLVEKVFVMPAPSISMVANPACGERIAKTGKYALMLAPLSVNGDRVPEYSMIGYLFANNETEARAWTDRFGGCRNPPTPYMSVSYQIIWGPTLARTVYAAGGVIEEPTFS
jgi:hypothetical protein